MTEMHFLCYNVNKNYLETYCIYTQIYSDPPVFCFPLKNAESDKNGHNFGSPKIDVIVYLISVNHLVVAMSNENWTVILTT